MSGLSIHFTGSAVIFLNECKLNRGSIYKCCTECVCVHLGGYADSVMINNFMGLELTHTSRIISEHCHGDE